jgi:hypothetical protein
MKLIDDNKIKSTIIERLAFYVALISGFVIFAGIAVWSSFGIRQRLY